MNRTDKREEPLFRFPGIHEGPGEGRAMRKKKSVKKQTVTVSQEELLFPDLDPPLPLCLKVLLLWRAEQLFNLGLRVSKCISALQEYTDFPDEAEMNSFLNKCSKFKKAQFVGNAAKGCLALGITTIEDSFRAVREALNGKIDNPQSLASLRFACLTASIIYRHEHVGMQQNELETFCILEQRLTNKTCETIGYWTAVLKEKKRNKHSAEEKSKRAKERGSKIEPLIKAIAEEPDKIKKSRLLADAMGKAGYTDIRSIKNLVKKYKNGKTAGIS